MEDTSKIVPNQPSKGLVTDLHSSLVAGEYWTHARNVVMNSHLGQIQQIQNEPSTISCVTLPYTPIGFIKLLNARWAVFTTDNTSSEIGIFDEKACTYTRLVNANCLGFNTRYLIEGHSKEMFDCTETIYWTDAFNPRRYLNLSNIPYKYTIKDDSCKTKVPSTDLDCDELMIERKITVPNISVRRSTGGGLRNGSYEFTIAYSNNKQRISDYYSITSPHQIWSHQNYGQALEIEITNLDRDFDEYELAVIYTIDGVDTYKTIGYYPTSVTGHHISSVDRPEYIKLDVLEIITKRPRYPIADGVEANDQYLLWHGVRTSKELNYQLQAMKIRSKYIVYQVPVDYYEKEGSLVGYMRDEVYCFGMQWLHSNGEWSPAYHIPGRANNGDTDLATGRDVYELLIQDQVCDTPVEVPRYIVENTAGDMGPINTQAVCNEKVIGEGEMAYWQSTELYPNNAEMFGDSRCKPILHPRFPDNCKTHIYSSQGRFMNILGIQFENIEHPLDSEGKKVEDIVGFRIVRGDRRGNKSVVAKGVFTNVRSYKETDGQEVLYANYPYNDLREDTFLSSKQTRFVNSERDYIPLTDYKKDSFNFYSPDTLFNRISLGEEVVFYTEEISKVEGYFEEVYKHPTAKLLTQFDLYFALVIGAIDGYMSTKGKKCIVEYTNGNRVVTVVNTTPPGAATQTESLVGLQQQQLCDDILNGMTATDHSKKLTDIPDKIIIKALKALAAAGMFAYFALKTANAVLDVIANVSPWRQYSLQYDSVGKFNSFRCVKKDFRRRYLPYYQYLSDGINTVEGTSFNNYKREESVFIRINDEVNNPSTTDTSRKSISDFGICDTPFNRVQSTASLFYGAIKRKVPNQYGQLDNITYLDTGHNVLPLTKTITELDIYETGPIFGGDTYINPMTIKRSHHFFSQFLHDVPPGYILDYRQYRNVGFPRYWIDTSPYDMSEFVVPKPSQSNTPRAKHLLDCQGNNATKGITTVKDRYFYLFNSGVLQFFVESEYNIANRDWKADAPNFYSRFNSDLTRLFRSDVIEDREEFTFDNSYFKQLIENSIIQQRLDFNPILEESCFKYLKNRVIYSLPAFKDQKADNWLVYLANNYYDFPMHDFGGLTTIKAIDNQQLMFLFDKSSPYITIGRDELQLEGSGTKITIGDGGLFARPPRPIAHTDYYYGNCQSKWAFVNTQFGSFYPSQRQGRIFNWSGQLDEVTRNGNHWWFKNYLPSYILEDFPNYPHYDNPVLGVGLLSAFDNTDERYYLTKRDYRLKDSARGVVTYDTDNDTFKTGEALIDITDKNYFEDASWTISYSPKDKTFVSWHDWHPDWTLQGENHFMSVRNNTIWKHNQTCTSFCNFYNTDYPHEFEYVENNNGEVDVLRSVEFQSQTGIYYSCRDFHHILDETYDFMTVHNSEQMSGLLKLELQNKRDMSQLIGFPKFEQQNDWIRVLYNKEEQRYRINQFSDIAKDRGEFTGKNYPLLLTQPNGYIRDINKLAIDYQKPPQHRKKFRHTNNKVWLRKSTSKNKKLIFNFALAKTLKSIR